MGRTSGTGSESMCRQVPGKGRDPTGGFQNKIQHEGQAQSPERGQRFLWAEEAALPASRVRAHHLLAPLCHPVGLGPAARGALWRTAPTPRSWLRPRFGSFPRSTVSDLTVSNLTCSQPRARAGGSPRRLLPLRNGSRPHGPCVSAAPAGPARLLEGLKIDFFFNYVHICLCSPCQIPSGFFNDRFIPSTLLPSWCGCAKGGGSESQRASLRRQAPERSAEQTAVGGSRRRGARRCGQGPGAPGGWRLVCPLRPEKPRCLHTAAAWGQAPRQTEEQVMSRTGGPGRAPRHPPSPGVREADAVSHPETGGQLVTEQSPSAPKSRFLRRHEQTRGAWPR